MQIVIDIPDKYKKQFDENRCKEKFDSLATNEFGYILRKAFENGTPLTKGHGRLIDADELYGDFIDGTEGYDCQTWNRLEIGDIIEDAPTIIEADTESEVTGNDC